MDTRPLATSHPNHQDGTTPAPSVPTGERREIRAFRKAGSAGSRLAPARAPAQLPSSEKAERLVPTQAPARSAASAHASWVDARAVRRSEGEIFFFPPLAPAPVLPPPATYWASKLARLGGSATGRGPREPASEVRRPERQSAGAVTAAILGRLKAAAS